MAAALTSTFAGLSLHSSRCSLRGTRVAGPAPLRLVAPVAAPLTIEAAHKKGAGSTKNGRDSVSKRRGVKVYGGQAIKAGGIIVRQLGNKFHAGQGVGCGKDFTLFALTEGIVVFKKTKYRKMITIVPVEEYVVPEGQRVQEGSRKMRRREQYTSRKVAVAVEA